ncbi:MAG: PD-(D/E)XK nuclease family protein [Betaproteobacteria bacterium]|nr:PD-(D/E)XK nuclease family protein [Betaproteobacteria bacterium]
MLGQRYLHAAREVLAQARQHGFEPVQARVLVPNFHAGTELARALVSVSGQPALLPPRMSTFPAWAAEAGVSGPLLPDSRRALLVYQALRARRWFDESLLWPVSIELGRLFDEMTRQAIRLPEDEVVFARQLMAAYRVRAHQYVEFEARLVHELWFALMRPDAGGARMPQVQYAMQLAWQADHADMPLFVLGLGGLTRQESECLERYALRQPVWWLDMRARDAAAACLHAAWPETQETGLIGRAGQLVQQLNESPWPGRLTLVGARGLEQEARSAEAQIHRWLHAGHTRIAVVVHDRLTARRLRALLERNSILVADETGWSLDTTVAGGLVMRWLEAVRDDFPAQAVQDWLQAPQWLVHCNRSERERINVQASQLLRRKPRLSGLEGWLAHFAAQDQHALLHAALDQMFQAAHGLRGSQRPLTAWLGALLDSLALLGIDAWLQADQAGASLLALLAARRQELLTAGQALTLAEFIRWVEHELQAGSFVDEHVDSPLVFTHLAALRLRRFDAALLLGADDRQLPDNGALSGWFNQRVRSELGLPLRADLWRQTEADLFSLLTDVPRVCVIWQDERDGEANPLASWFERLDTLHVLAWGRSLRSAPVRWQPQRPAVAAPAMAPRPIVPADELPTRISVSAHHSLMACPYQFFTRHILGLRMPEDTDAGMQKSDYGQRVHEILHTFHMRHPRLTELQPEQAEAALGEMSRRLFLRDLRQDFMAYGWLERWLQQVPGYVRWQLEREAQGWNWTEGECDFERAFEIDATRQLVLHGRIDRIDRRADDVAVLDYKTGSVKGLRDSAAQPEEDVQLASYALLLQQPVKESAFVALDGEAVDSVPLTEPLDELALCCENRLVDIFRRLHAGDGLPAQGTDAVCEHCEARGLCRRDDRIGESAG